MPSLHTMDHSVTIGTLPFETLLHIFSYISSDQQIPRLSRVCKRWALSVRDIRVLELECSVAVFKYGLPRILFQYPRLCRLVLNPARSIAREVAAGLVDQVAAQFTGHPTVQHIWCSSDWIVPGAIDGCPVLKELRLISHSSDLRDDAPPIAEETMVADNMAAAAVAIVSTPAAPAHREIWNASGLRRNLTWILKSKPWLTHVQMDHPHLWARASQDTAVQTSFALRSLNLTSLTASSILSFIDFLNPRQLGAASVLPHLTTLSMEIDYAFLPRTMFAALAAGCPLLSSLTLSTLEAPPSMICTMATDLAHLPLTKLVFDKCSVWFVEGWVTLIRYISAAFRSLDTMEFERCLFRELPEGRVPAAIPTIGGMRTFTRSHPLKALKLHPIGDFALSVEDVRFLIDRFPNLVHLHLDVPADTCTATKMPIWAPSATINLKSLSRLKLRCGNPRGLKTMPYESDIPAQFRNLTYLSLTSCPVFPTQLIHCNAAALNTLKLSYLPAVLPAGFTISLPNLCKLTIRGVSILGHKICLATATALTYNAPRLKSLRMEAFQSAQAFLAIPESFIQDLVLSCPHIRDLRLSGFTVPPFTLRLLEHHWPLLSTFHIVGPNSLPVATAQWECDHLTPMLLAHRHLTSVHLTLTGLNTGECVLPRIDDPDQMARDVGYVQRKAEAQMLYAEYARLLASRFWWIQDVVISGPIAM
ncbi:hypothetical protein DFJ77DRAFT_540387 [Powellomyces hirtus]|nr:hypothetical protein DFJ77DRAFT_540387 [Powellomyces hirtus]